MKLLYLSCHEILEYDEIKLFLELGIDVFSYGAYLNPYPESGGKRLPLPLNQDPKLVQLANACRKEKMLSELIEPFDVIYSMHVPSYIINNWDLIKHKKVIWRTIGQSTQQVEDALEPMRYEGLKIVRYSPREKTIPNYLGGDAMIRFYKDPNEFKGWSGDNIRVMNVSQSMEKRDHFCNWELFKYMMQGFPWVIYGPENEWAGVNNGGLLSYETLKKMFQTNRVYFYTGTFPASYTLNFIEAWMTGIPVVAIGPRWGNAKFFRGQSTYEIQDLIENGVDGFYSDNPDELREALLLCLGSKEFAREIGDRGRKKAIKYFGKDSIKKQWKRFFRGL